MSATNVVLHKYIPIWGLADLSPFCCKVDTYLRMAHIPYTTVVGDPRKAPKQKLPILDDGALQIADSSAIIAHLEATRGAPLDAGLSAQQRALATAVRSMIEEHLYFTIVYQRWQEDDNWLVYREVFKTLAGALGVPGFMRGFVVKQIRKGMLQALHGQGTGRHSPAENAATAQRLLDSLEALCVGPYFLGDRPRVIDATVYGFVAGLRAAPFKDAIAGHFARMHTLNAYCDHMHSQFFAQGQ